MKKVLIFLATLLFLLNSGSAQTIQYTYQVTGSFGATGTSVVYNIIATGAAFHTLVWNDSGTVSTCSIRVDGSADGITFGTGDVIAAQTCTSNGTFTSASVVPNYVRVNLVTLTGGGTVNFNLTGYLSSPSGGGGLPAGLTYVAPTLTVSTAGAGSGVLALSGNTSGTATITAPAVAGTTTNAFILSNVLQIPAGTNCSGGGGGAVGFSNGTQRPGLWFSTLSNGTVILGNASACAFGINNTVVTSAVPLGWAAAGTFNTSDVAFSRTAAGNISLGNGTAADETALLRMGNSCRAAADITLSTAATNVCSFALPAVAKVWRFNCDIPWAVTAGTTPTLSLGVNASQTPGATTSVSGSILTTNTGTSTQANVALSASGALNVLTSPTLTPAATVFQSRVFGTLSASGTAGTLAITMTGVGTGFAGAAKAGASCELY